MCEKRSKKLHTDDVSPPISEQCFWWVEANFPRGTTNQNYYPDLGTEMSAVWQLKQQRFWATHVNRKRAFFSLLMPWRHHICMAKWLYSYRDDLPKGLFKITAAECKKSRLPVDVRISTLVPQLSFAGKLIVASQIHLFSQTYLYRKNMRLVLIKLFPSIIGSFFWNDIPQSIRDKPSKKMFKKALLRWYLAQY